MYQDNSYTIETNVDIVPTPKEKAFVEANCDANVSELALKIRPKDGLRTILVLRQIAGKQAMKRKMPLWADNPDIVYPIHLSVEQCSSQFTACYKREILQRLCSNIANNNFADLTSGFGVDFSVMSEGFAHKYYVERNRELCNIAEHNFRVLGMQNYTVLCTNGMDYIQNTPLHFGAIYIDPARRSESGSKIVHIQDCEPNVLEYMDVVTQKADVVIIKLSPMLDISECMLKLKNIAEIHVVAAHNECKEIIVVLKNSLENTTPIIYASADNADTIKFTKSDEQSIRPQIADRVGEGMWLYEPNPAIMKAGAYNTLAQLFALQPISVNSHLYVSDTYVEKFPGRSFKIVGTGTAKNFKNIKQANITVRNFPMKADELRKKLKIKDGGDIYLFATTLANGSKILIETRKF